MLSFAVSATATGVVWMPYVLLTAKSGYEGVWISVSMMPLMMPTESTLTRLLGQSGKRVFWMMLATSGAKWPPLGGVSDGCRGGQRKGVAH